MVKRERGFANRCHIVHIIAEKEPLPYLKFLTTTDSPSPHIHISAAPGWRRKATNLQFLIQKPTGSPSEPPPLLQA